METQRELEIEVYRIVMPEFVKQFLTGLGSFILALLLIRGIFKSNVRTGGHIQALIIILFLGGIYYMASGMVIGVGSLFSSGSTNQHVYTPTVLSFPSQVATIAWNAPTRSSQSICILWSEVTASMEGQHKCVKGIPVSQYPAEYGTYIQFSNSGDTFYFIDLYQGDIFYYYGLSPGDCIQGEGIVKTYQGIPRIEVTGLKNCN